MQKVNWGIIGLGSIANEFAKAFNNLNYAKLLAISSKDKKRSIFLKIILKFKIITASTIIMNL